MPSREDFQFDVFLSYKKPDFDAVGKVAHQLRDRGIRVWWDEWCARPGFDFQDSLNYGLQNSWSTAVFIGPPRDGGWQEREIKSAINYQAQDKRPVAAVFLPQAGDPDKVELPPFLGLNTRIVFSASTEEETALRRLVWAITGANPFTVLPETASIPVNTTTTDDALEFLSSWLKDSGKITFFIGPAASQINPDYPPRDCEIAKRLLQELKLLPADDRHVLLPMDVAATIYGIGKTDPVLERTVVNHILERSAKTPPIHESLARLLAKIAGRNAPRGRKPQKQLILTTNIDIMTERALLRAGLSFTRVVQHKSEASVYVSKFRLTQADRLAIPDLDEWISNQDVQPTAPESITSSALEEPILFKLRGSHDIPGSCALTRPQLLQLARSVIKQRLVPDELQKIPSNSPVVFLGTGVLAPDFQMVSNTLLFDAWSSDHKKFLIQLAPDLDTDDPFRQMEAGIWDKVKQSAMRMNLVTVEEQGDRFLRRLVAKLEEP